MNSGTVWPGTNSARSIRISIVDGATCTVTPRWWQRSTSSTARSCGNSGSAMITSWIRSRAEHLRQLLERPQRAQAVLRSGRQRDVAGHVDPHPRPARERVGDRLDVLARADQQRSALVPGLLEQPARDAEVQLAQRRRCRPRRRTTSRRRCSSSEKCSPLASANTSEMIVVWNSAVAIRREPGPARPVGVQVAAGEHQHGDQVGERRPVPGLRPRAPPVEVALDGELEYQRGEHRARPRRRSRARAARRRGRRGETSPAAAGTRAAVGACGARRAPAAQTGQLTDRAVPAGSAYLCPESSRRAACKWSCFPYSLVTVSGTRSFGVAGGPGNPRSANRSAARWHGSRPSSAFQRETAEDALAALT